MTTNGDQIVPSQNTLIARLRHLEVTAYGAVVSALQAQGELSWEKQKVIDRLRNIFHISNERHQAEISRAETDQKIQQLARAKLTVTQQQRDDLDVYSFVASDTESGSDNEYTPKTTRSRRGRRPSIGGGTNTILNEPGSPRVPKKRGRKPKPKPEAEDPLEPKKKRGRKKKNADENSTVPSNEYVPSVPEVHHQQSIIQPKEEEEENDEELNNATVEQIEEIATKENSEIEELEKQLEATQDPDEKNRIMAALKPKQARLYKLIDRLEKADSQDPAPDTKEAMDTSGDIAQITTGVI